MVIISIYYKMHAKYVFCNAYAVIFIYIIKILFYLY